MPCQSDYLEPNAREQESKLVAELLIYVVESLGGIPLPAIRKAAKNPYGYHKKTDVWTRELCRFLDGMDTAQTNTIVYNARNRSARKLADWWEHHQEADRQREAAEASEKAKLATRKRALAKLSTEEIAALGLRY